MVSTGLEGVKRDMGWSFLTGSISGRRRYGRGYVHSLPPLFGT